MTSFSQVAQSSHKNYAKKWSLTDVTAIYTQPFNDLLFEAQIAHRKYFKPNTVQTSTLMSIKTGACPEDCKYCSQSGHYNTKLENEQLKQVEEIIEQAKQAKANGSSRFCMGAAWRSPPEKSMPALTKMIKEVKAMGMETCMTLGMLTNEQSQQLKAAGLDYYNHNLDTSPDYYKNIITTRNYQNRLDTLQNVRASGMKVCSGGIIGMGETRKDRIALLQQLANLPQHPESVPINRLVAIKETPLEHVEPLDGIEFVRTIATARIIMPSSYVRLSAGRETMDDSLQSLCFLAGANSIFSGEKLLTVGNTQEGADAALFAQLGITAEAIAGESLLKQLTPQATSKAYPVS